MKPKHKLLRRINWHPATPGLMLGIMAYTISNKGFTSIRIVALAVLSLWFALALYNLLSKGKLLDWMYPEAEDTES